MTTVILFAEYPPTPLEQVRTVSVTAVTYNRLLPVQAELALARERFGIPSVASWGEARVDPLNSRNVLVVFHWWETDLGSSEVYIE